MTTLSHVELGVLGPLQVRQYGLPVAVPGAKPRAVLTMLGLHGGSVVTADALAELLWGARPPRTAVKALQTHISSLRRALGEGYVLTEGTGWTLSTTEIDATRYRLAAKQGRDAFAGGDAGQAVASFDEALGLWRGVPELPDGPRGGAEKTRWIEGHAALVEDRADALLATGRAAEIVGELEAAVADAPLRERRWGQLMLALYRAGRQGEALAAYQRARSMLADELGVDPGPDLRRLEAAIVAQDAALEIAVPEQLSIVTRAVTFLLTDIEGSTAAWEADADAMATALARHDEVVEQVVTARGGRLIKTRGEGDATFSVFDRPSAAAAAAIELQQAIRHEPWALAEPMRVRVALHTGEVELRDGDYFGRAVNRAARLRSLAEGGQILCSGATAELVIDTLSDDVVLADLGMRHLRNLARPEHVFELRLETAEEAAEPAAEAPIQRPALPAVLAGPGPFVGRVPELEGLLAAWESTLAAGARAVLISGEPGVGKTRLAGEWSRLAYEQGAVVLYGRCDEDLGAAYQPFAEALRSLVPCLGADRLRGMRGIEALLPLVPGLTDTVPDLPTPARSDPDTERYALFDAVVALLAMASASAPVVLILDDLHWAAKPTLLLLRHLLRFGEHARVQIVGTYRSTDLDRSHPLAAMLADLHRDGSASRLALGGLDEDDVTAYVAEVGYDDVELARALASVTGGNPFFLIEALRHVAESGGRWDPSTLPQGVREAVSRRLSRLPAETNKALAAAAVVGARFPLALVEQVVGEDLIDAFDEACKAGIVIEEPGGRYRFNHALVRQSLLAELASVRRMRLHQRIATTLEAESGADEELLAELAYHYFECAWAGNAAKAVEYCRRAADQAIERLAYEGAADLYDRALHALEELDDELPDREALQAELMVARCEALLAAGDVGSAEGAVSQLCRTAGDSVRLAAWGTAFDGQLKMLTEPERLDEIEAEVSVAAQELAELDDAAGEANAHTVRAACLARLGRIADAETALDQALTAARRARDHRRVNAVLAGAPLAALWGPNPVPRAGGRCLDVVRLLRITTGSPVVEATSTRCQGVLDAMRGRAAAGRQLIDSARRTLTELGMRHALLEVDQFAGVIELIADDPTAAEPHLRRAYDGFRRMGLDADTAETAAFLARTCLLLDRDAEADELCRESERLAGHALRPSITWRTVRALLNAREGTHGEARRVAQEAVSIAERTDALVDHGDACLTLAIVLGIAGDVAGSRAAAEQAVALFERKGAAALVERARSVLGSETSAAPSKPETPIVEPDNECVRMLRRVEAAVGREAWNEVEQAHAAVGSLESRRKIVGFERLDIPASGMASGAKRFVRDMRAVRTGRPIVAIRGERLALTRTFVGTADDSPGAPLDEMLQLVGLDEDGRIALQIWFDVDDLDAAIAEMEAQHARLMLDNDCVRAIRRLDSAFGRNAWEDVEQLVATRVAIESRRRTVGMTPTEVSSAEWIRGARSYRDVSASPRTSEIIGVRGERLALARVQIDTADHSPGAPRDEMLMLYGLDERGCIARQVWFDVDDMDAAIAELDEAYSRWEGGCTLVLENAAGRADHRLNALFAEKSWDEIVALFTEDIHVEDRRRGLRREGFDRDAMLTEIRAIAGIGVKRMTSSAVAVRGDRLALVRSLYTGRDQAPDAFRTELLRVVEVDVSGRIAAYIVFDSDDLDLAMTELDARYLAGEAAPHAHVWQSVMSTLFEANRHQSGPIMSRVRYVDHRRISFGSNDFGRAVEELWTLVPDARYQVAAVHALDSHGIVATLVIEGADTQGNQLQWPRIVLFLPEEPRMEVYDDNDLNAALARLDELDRPVPRLDNTANRVLENYLSHYAARDWDAMAPTLADDFEADDRRRVVNGGVRHGRENEIASLKAMVEIGCANITTEPVAIRGDRLVLARHTFIAPDWPDFDTETVDVVEIDADNRIVAEILFEAENLDAAFAELEARYLAGEGSEHAHRWSVIAEGYAGLNRREMPSASPNLVNIDHRRGTHFASGDLIPFIHASWADTTVNRIFVRAVHRLTDDGALVASATSATTEDGFDAEWCEFCILMFEGDMFSHVEVFDEAELDAALARFDELSRPAPQLENDATRTSARFDVLFNARDWRAIAELYAEDVSADDRRRVVSGGPRRGRDAEIANLRAMADVAAAQIDSTVLAIRGRRLGLFRSRVLDDDVSVEGFFLSVLELNADGLIVGVVGFDDEDLDAAFAELDARYIAGEAADYARAWTVVAESYAALNRQEVPARTADWVNVDHRLGSPVEPGDLVPHVRAAWKLTPNINFRIQAVYRLDSFGAVFARATRGTSEDGFDAEWRSIDLLAVEGDVTSRVEIFDEADLDAALARFDELSRNAPQLENTASRLLDRNMALFEARDWHAMGDALAEDFLHDDRRRVVRAGTRVGRDSEIANEKALAEIGFTKMTSHPVATRGERLLLTNLGVTVNYGAETLNNVSTVVVETNANDEIVATIAFENDDIDSAFAELDARYLAGEAAEFARTWLVVSGSYAAVNRHELPAWTTDAVNFDHRSAAAIAPGDLAPYIRAMWGQTPDVRVDVIAVHRLTHFGAVVTHVATGTADQGFEGEWREITLSIVEGDRISRSEMFDEADLDAALARFDEVAQPTMRLHNSASRVEERAQAYIEAGNWNAMAGILADDVSIDDRRRVVNAGLRRGRDAVVEDLRVGAEIGLTQIRPTAIAIRGENLTLRHIRYSGGEQRPDSGVIDLVQIVEIDSGERIAGLVLFDADNLDAALAELDARYAAGEAAEYARTWSAITGSCAALNQRTLPAAAPDFVDVDRRRLSNIGSANMKQFFRASWELTPNLVTFIESVHRLSDVGAVVTQVAQGNSEDGFYAEWRVTNVYAVDGGLLSRCEVFDEADLDAALARFEEISRRPQPVENTVTRTYQRFLDYFAERDWNGMAAMVASNNRYDDRRRVVNAGTELGRDSVIASMRAVADVGVTVIEAVFIATRGDRIALARQRVSGGRAPEAFGIEVLIVTEVDADDKVVGSVAFDIDDIDAAYEELDKRYIAGEAARYAQTWAAIAEGYAAANNHHLNLSPDSVTIDHRRARAFEPGELAQYMDATWNLAPNVGVRIETVHRLTDLGAVVTHVASGASQQGFEAEWREVILLTVGNDLINRCEMFDEADLEAALALFDQLGQPARRLENAATRVIERFSAHFAVQNWDAVAELLADDVCDDDRRRVVNSAIQRGRDAQLANLRVLADVGVGSFESIVIATRGQRLALTRTKVTADGDPSGTYFLETLTIGEINADGQIKSSVHFDDLGAAFAELDSRYLAGEAAPYANVYSVIAGAFAAVNRREIPATTEDFVSIDHRRPIAFAPGEMMAYLQATLNDTPEIRIDIETVHRLNGRGAVISHTWHNTSQQGFDAEWRVVGVTTIEGDVINRCELYDEADLGAALARFDELSRSTTRLNNAATRLGERFRASFEARDWDAMAETLAEDMCNADRRSVVNGGIRYGRDSILEDMRSAAEIGVPSFTVVDIATRGERLVLVRAESRYGALPGEFYVENLAVGEINADGRLSAQVMFDTDALDAAFAELDARYLAGEAAAHTDTWSVITAAYAALNRHEIPPTTPDWANIDHRRGGSTFATGDMATYIRASWEDSPQNKIRVEQVHRLSHLGAVVTSATRGVSAAGFYAEWRQVDLVTVDGNMLSRTELFDEDDLEVALTKFDELSRPTVQLENAASRAEERARDCFATRNWAAMADLLADTISFEDRRRVVNAGVRNGRDAAISDARTVAELGGKVITSDVIATRGERLSLALSHLSSRDQGPGAFQAESLCVTTTDADGQIAARVVFDPEDLDSALAEIDARYIDGEGTVYSHTWSLVTSAYTAFNRHQFPSGTKDFVSIDHRRGIASAPGDMADYVRAVWEIAPDAKAYVETAYRVGSIGAVVVVPARGTTREGFDAEWREVHLLAFEGDLISRLEIFDEADLDTAIARFDELTAPVPRLDNAALRAWRRFSEVYNRRDLDGFLAVHDTNARYDDRRKGLRDEGPVGPDVGRALLFEASPSWRLEIEPIATRGEALGLICGRFRDTDEPDQPSAVEVFAVVEVSDRELITREVFFDPNAFDSAMAELDASFLAAHSEACSHTWNLVNQTYARFNRHELSPTTPDWVNVDHRRAMVPAPGEMNEYVTAMWEVAPDVQTCIESVHRLTSFGALFTHAEVGTSHLGFAAEWREITLLAFDGDLISRCELFDVDDLDAALSRFDELSTPATPLDNAATRGDGRAADAFNRGDLEGYLGVLAPNAQYEDRRRGLRNAGPIDREFVRGLLFTGPSSWVVELAPVAIRGGYLALVRHICRDNDEVGRPVVAEVLAVVEANDDEAICRSVLFDPDEMAAAFEELDARYVAGEAAGHAQVWSVVTSTYDEMNRHEFSPTKMAWFPVDNRTIPTIESSGLAETMSASWDLVPDLSMYVEAVHRLSNLGAVVTNRTFGTSKDGFDAEWRMIQVLTVQAGQVDRLEIFDESDVDAALARLDELSRPETKLVNAATRARAYVCDVYNRHDVEKFLALAIGRYDDRRKGLQYEGAADRDFATSIVSETPTSWRLESEPVGIRGDRLALSRDVFRDTGDGELPITVEMLVLTDITDESVAETVVFDYDDIDAAFAELTARWMASGEVAHPEAIRFAQHVFETFNRHDWETFTTYLRDATYVSHRQLGIDDADISDYLLSVQMWVSLIPDLWTEAAEVLVHSAIGGVVSVVLKGTSTNGTVVEIPSIVLALNDGDRVTHLETYDPDQRDMALARFDELNS